MKVIVCGGRDNWDWDGLWRALNAIHKRTPITHLMHGGATGVDQMAYVWAAERMIDVTVFRADWKAHGRAAGPIRNGHMLDQKPDLLIALPGGRGTADMVRQAEARGVPVKEVKP